MSDKTKLSKVISGESQAAYERWEVPNAKSLKQRTLEKAGLTARQLEAIQKQAYDEGFKLGNKEGHKEGLEKGQEEGRQQGNLKGQDEVAQTVKHFEQIIKFLSRPLEQVDQKVEEELIDLSMATAKQIIRREIHADPGQIIAVIKEALSALPSNSKKIKVFLHPSDAEIARENLMGNRSEQEDESFTVVDEPNITRGGCRIKSESSQIDASIETRIAEIAARILGDERINIEDDSDETEFSSDSEEIENDR